ncbi:MAG TPA: hypothetical protein VFP72_02240 [Kineosporiaceae bacterium]|nr:hypothetical protein [Kineosporiaceae bacterium]
MFDPVRSEASPDATPLDPRALQVLLPCARVLAADPDGFVDLLHQHLVALVPDAAAASAQAGLAVCDRVARAALAAATGERPVTEVAALLQQAGVDNFRDGFPAEQYLAVGHALLRAAHEAYPAQWSTELGSAWIAYFVWVRTHLLRGGATALAVDWARADGEAVRHRTAGVTGPPDGPRSG